MSAAPPASGDGELLDAVMAIASELDLAEVLDLIVRRACTLTKAAYGALGVLSAPGARTPVELEQFHHVGLSPARARSLSSPPRGHGVLGVLIEDPRPLRLVDLSAHPASVGLPPTHPPMHTFLGVPIRVRGVVFGNLYLCEKAGGTAFTDEDERVIVGLAAAAGIAIDNARLFFEVRARQAWAAAAAQVSSELAHDLQGAPALVARLAHEAAGGTSAVCLAPATGDGVAPRPPGGARTLTVRGAAGPGAERLLHQEVRDDRPGLVSAQLFDDASGCAEILLDAGDRALGLLVLQREGQRWTDAELAAARTFGTQVALALDHARGEHDRHRLAVFADRDRIARDLHDRVIQRLFAVGLGLHSLLGTVDGSDNRSRLGTYIEDLRATITEIRTSIFFLHHDPSAGPHSLRSDVLTVVGESSRILEFTPQVTFRGPVDQPLPPHLRTDLLATLRESLSNVIRHAHARAVDVAVHWDVDGRQVTLQVDDDGSGLDPNAVPGLGLRNTAARAQAAGGTAEAVRREGGGTSFRWVIPLPPPDPA
ncbi:two-component system sensor histidine kinase [Microlunatus lacustris]